MQLDISITFVLFKLTSSNKEMNIKVVLSELKPILAQLWAVMRRFLGTRMMTFFFGIPSCNIYVVFTTSGRCLMQ